MPRSCKACKHPQVKAINKLILNGKSLRHISSQYELSDHGVMRHTENCLKRTLGAIKEQHKERQAVDIYKEFEEQLEFARNLRLAAQKWLTVNDEVDLDPRAGEVMVVYLDHLDAKQNGEPKQKKLKLDALLELATVEDAREPQFATVKTMDLRKFALEAVTVTDTCIDRFARLSGMYQQERSNTQDAELAKLKGRIEARAREKDLTYEAELDNFLEHHAEDVPPVLRERLASELIQ